MGGRPARVHAIARHEDHDRARTESADRLRKVDTIERAEHDVGEHDVDLVRLEQSERRLPIVGDVHDVPLAAKDFRRKPGYRLVVVDNEHRACASVHTS